MARISFYHVEIVKEESHNYNISRDMSSSQNVAIFLANVLRINKSPVENFGVLVLDVHNNLIASHVLTKGTLNATRVCQEFCVNRFNKQHRIAA